MGTLHILAKSRSLDMNQTHVLMDDATCYESYIKFPTDVKLLFDCSEWLFDHIDLLSEELSIKKPRSKYKHQQTRQLTYQKQKTRKQTRARQRNLLFWVDRGLDLLQQILNAHPKIHRSLGESFYFRIKTIRIKFSQQQYHYDDPIASIPNRIVSLFKV